MPNAKYTSVFKVRCPILLYNVMSHNLLIYSVLFMCVVEFVIKHLIKFAIKGCCNVSESSPSSQNNVHHDLVYSFE